MTVWLKRASATPTPVAAAAAIPAPAPLAPAPLPAARPAPVYGTRTRARMVSRFSVVALAASVCMLSASVMITIALLLWQAGWLGL